MLVLALLAGCATVEETPPAEPIRLIVTPNAAHLLPAWVEDVRADIQTAPFADALRMMDAGDADLLITFGLPPDDWFVTPLAVDGFAVITHDDVVAQSISLQDLQSIYSGAITAWDVLDGGDEDVQLFLPFQGDALRARLEALLGWTDAAAPTAILLPTPAAAMGAVAETAGGLAIVPYSMLGEDADILRVDGVRPGPSTLANSRYPLTVEVLAMAPEEPEGAPRAWLVSLQTPTHEGTADPETE